MKKQICIATQSHLCRNPRVLKEAITLAGHGYQITLLTCLTSAPLQAEDLDLVKGYPSITIHWIADLTGNTFRVFANRAVFKIGRAVNRYLKISNYWALGYGSLVYLKAARAIKADLYICHQELATYVGTKLIKANCKVGFDFEDWYSADLLPEAQNSRPIGLLKKIEHFALANGAFCITTSQALAKKLTDTYRVKLADVIYNVFPQQDEFISKVKEFDKPLKLFWFSQTIGPGRGIEKFIGHLNTILADIELHFLGDIDLYYRNGLVKLMKGKHTLIFHNLVSDEELPTKIAEFDIGLALELTDPPSRNYTITNKFFQYLQSGLPVVATETTGQAEGFEKFKPGIMIAQHPEASEIKNLEDWLNDTEAIKKAAVAAKNAARFYSWENESGKLLNIVNNALQQ